MLQNRVLQDQLAAALEKSDHEESVQIQSAIKALEDAQQAAYGKWERENQLLRDKLEHGDAAAAKPSSSVGGRIASMLKRTAPSSPSPSSSSVIELMGQVEQQQQKEWREIAAKNAAMTEKLEQARKVRDHETAAEVQSTMAVLEQQQQEQYAKWTEQNEGLRGQLAEAQAHEAAMDAEVQQLRQEQEDAEHEHSASIARLKQEHAAELVGLKSQLSTPPTPVSVAEEMREAEIAQVRALIRYLFGTGPTNSHICSLAVRRSVRARAPESRPPRAARRRHQGQQRKGVGDGPAGHEGARGRAAAVARRLGA